jgi:DNA-binding SARP family transcriptional activator
LPRFEVKIGQGADAGTRIPVVAAKLRVPAADSYGLARLDVLMGRLWGRRLGLVVAPAGAGKTTLIARFASSAGVPVAWYRCESWDVSAQQLLLHLSEAFAPVLGKPCDWHTVEEAVFDLDPLPAARVLLVIDDGHAIDGTPAARALERLLDYAPTGLLTLVASRRQPDFNLPRLRVSGGLAEITGEDLRFRSWEVENLFRDFYQEPLPPVELAELARRTEGWAAGLQLFHLATTGKGLDERRRILRNLGGGSRLVREYLARNVLDELPALLRAFLLDTCVLGRLSGPICDRFLNRDDSEALLQELERRQVFTSAVGDDGDYRYHEVLRSHLEHVLVSEAGEHVLGIRYGAAGRVLEQFGAIPEALHAYCRAEEWDEVDRVLGNNGAQLAGHGGVWIDALPPAVLEHDPWLLLASARRHRAEGRWRSAVDAYQKAESGLTGGEVVETCRRERLALSLWLSSSVAPATDTLGLLRQATVRDPLAIRAQLAARPAGLDALATGVASMLGGELAEARRSLSAAASTPDAGDATPLAARVGAGIASVLMGEDATLPLRQAVEDADACGQGWIARLGRAGAALSGDPGAIADADAVATTCEHIGDAWGAAAAALFAAWGRLSTREAGATEVVRTLGDVAGRFRLLGASVLEAWSRSLLALAVAQAGDPEAFAAALKAESLANSAAVEGPKLFAYAAMLGTQPANRRQLEELVTALGARTRLAARFAVPAQKEGAPGPELALSIRCFGAFQMLIDGRPAAMGAMKPRTRALLRRLCVDAGAPIHRDVLQLDLWPGADPEAASRNLQVAVSSLRHALEPGVARGASSLVVRDGDSYRLVLPPGADVDVIAFEEALERSRRARLAADLDAAQEAFELAARIADRQLLPEDGSAEWVEARRGRIRAAVVDAARSLAPRLVAAGKPELAAGVATSGLAADRYDDGLWRLLIDAREKAGDAAGALRAQADYRSMLGELGPE